jgi:hypothetical protein
VSNRVVPADSDLRVCKCELTVRIRITGCGDSRDLGGFESDVVLSSGMFADFSLHPGRFKGFEPIPISACLDASGFVCSGLRSC